MLIQFTNTLCCLELVERWAMMKMVLFIMKSLRIKDLLVWEVSLTLTVNMASMVSLSLKDLLAEEVTLTLMGMLASLVRLRVKDPLVEEVSLMGQMYLVGALARKVMGVVGKY